MGRTKYAEALQPMKMQRLFKNSSGGKGDAPRNISKKFRDNFDQINWKRKSKDKPKKSK